MSIMQTAFSFVYATEVVLPRVAKERGYPVRLDHCFKRICMDNAVGGFWRDHVPAPFITNADPLQLLTALGIAAGIGHGVANVHALNQRSLQWRGKASPSRAAA